MSWDYKSLNPNQPRQNTERTIDTQAIQKYHMGQMLKVILGSKKTSGERGIKYLLQRYVMGAGYFISFRLD